MNYIKSALLILSSLMVLVLSSCRQDDANIVQPNTDTQYAKASTALGKVSTQPQVINGNMEDSSIGYWCGGIGSSGYQFNYTGSQYVSSSHSLSITAVSSAKSSFAFWAQTFDASSFVGRKISLTVKAKYLNVEGDGVMFVLRGDDTNPPEGNAEAFSTTQGRIVLTGTQDWTTVEVELDPVPQNIKTLTVYMLLSATQGTVYFDDLALSA